MNTTVTTASGVALALRDLLTRAGDGDLVGGRLEGALGDMSNYSNVTVYLTLGTQRYRIAITEVPVELASMPKSEPQEE